MKSSMKISLLCFSFAFVPVVQAHMSDGFYGGLGVGGVFDRYHLITRNVVTGFTVNSPVSSENKLLGRVFMGYGTTFGQRWYLGGEFGTAFPSRRTTIANRPGVSLTASTFTDQLYIRDYVTLDLLPGYQINKNWLLYVRAGGTYGKLSIYQFATPKSPEFGDREGKWGGRIGVGTRFAIHQHFALGLDYFYTRYQQKVSEVPQFTLQFNQSLHNHYVGVSLLWVPV